MNGLCVSSAAAAYQRALDVIHNYTHSVLYVCIVILVFQVLTIIIAIYYVCCKKPPTADYDSDDSGYEEDEVDGTIRRKTIERPKNGIRKRRGLHRIYILICL